eukprot:6571280-Pyramimonas_sp.AAC.1
MEIPMRIPMGAPMKIHIPMEVPMDMLLWIFIRLIFQWMFSWILQEASAPLACLMMSVLFWGYSLGTQWPTRTAAWEYFLALPGAKITPRCVAG